MLRPRTILSIASCALIAACGGSSSEPVQFLAHGIVSGNNQVAVAGATTLSSAVVEQMVRNSTGTISLRRVPDTWRDRVLDLAVPRAFAQGTVVNGSPVVGAVVCAVSTDPKVQLVPFTPCTNTGVDGKATFFFTPGTAAGLAKAEIRGTVANTPAVFDTATATIKPGAPTEIGLAWGGTGNQMNQIKIPTGGTIDLHKMIRLVRDQYANMIAPSSYTDVTGTSRLADTTSNYTPSYAVRAAGTSAPTAADATGWIVTPGTIPLGGTYVYLFGGAANPTYFLVQDQAQCGPGTPCSTWPTP
jgi:hypothetical protein